MDANDAEQERLSTKGVRTLWLRSDEQLKVEVSPYINELFEKHNRLFLSSIKKEASLKSRITSLLTFAGLRELWSWYRPQVALAYGRRHYYLAGAVSLLGRLLTEKDRDAFLGDLAEQYEAIKEDAGQRAADSWFRKQVARAILPLLWCRIRGYCKALVKRLSR